MSDLERNLDIFFGVTCFVIMTVSLVLDRKNEKNKPKRRLKLLAIFLWAYPTSTFFIGYLTNSFLPFWWVLLFVFPSILLYCFAKWLWKTSGDSKY